MKLIKITILAIILSSCTTYKATVNFSTDNTGYYEPKIIEVSKFRAYILNKRFVKKGCDKSIYENGFMFIEKCHVDSMRFRKSEIKQLMK